MEGVGAAFMLAGAAVLLALLSYRPTDPSWNTATAGPVANWMGLPGAWTADLLLQTIGYAGLLFGLAAVIWGLRIFARHAMPPLWARLCTVILAVLLAAVALARIGVPEGLVFSSLGGSGGLLLLNSAGGLLQPLLPAAAHTAVAVPAALGAGVLFLHVAGVTRSEIVEAFFMAGRLIRAAGAQVLYVFGRFVEWVQHYNDPDYEPRRKPVAVSAARRAPRLSGNEERDDETEDDTQEDEDEEEEEQEQQEGVGFAAARRPLAVRIKEPARAARPPARQQRLALGGGHWDLPAHDLLQEPPKAEGGRDVDQGALRRNADMLQSVLNDFNIEGQIVSIHPGPVVTLYELEPAPGVKTSRVISLADDIARSMSATSVRCAVIPGRNVIGIELPNARRQTVWMRELLDLRETQETRSVLPLVLGKDIGGAPVVADLARMPHLLVAGTTGSGKSVAVNTMILSLLYRLPPEKCRFIMIDPKMLELSVYDDIPHLLAPVVTEPGKAVVALKWTVNEMEERYRAMSKLGVRNIEGYNARLAEARKKGETLMRKVQTGFDSETGKPVFEEQPMDMNELPYIVVVVDEFADLMLVAGKDVENAVQRLAQMARAAGIHLIMATQRPSVDVITGVIKANFPTRISFQVTSRIDSRTILGEGGAEQLLGMGDMLYMAAGGRITRVHGPFVSDVDVESVVSHLRKQGEPSYVEDITTGGFAPEGDVMNALFGESGDGEVDELWDQAVALVARERKASTSFIQRYLNIGYNRAARIVEEMEKQGIVSPANRVGKREVLVGDYSDA